MKTENEPTKDLSIIIISYNTRELTRNCIRSIYDSEPTMSFEIIVYDNASQDGSLNALAEEFPQIKLIASDINIGFAAANNIARSSAVGERLLLLNPDTQIISTGIETLYQFADKHPKPGVFGGASYTLSNELDYRSCWGSPSLWSLMCRSLGLSVFGRNVPLLNPEEIPNWNRDSVRDVGVISGCFFMLDTDKWDELGGFDDDYFMYSEEADLCARAQKMSLDCVYVPYAKILHVGGASETSKSHKTVKLLNGKSIYYQKHWSGIAKFFAAFFIDIFVLSRRLAFNVGSGFSEKYVDRAKHWTEVWADRRKWHMKYTSLGRTVTYTISALHDEHLDSVTYYQISDSSLGRLA